MSDGREAVRKFLTAGGHDLCHENRRELAAAFGLEDLVPPVVSQADFALGCVRYRREIYGPDGPGSEGDVFSYAVRSLADEWDAEARRLPADDPVAAVLERCAERLRGMTI